MTQEQLSQLGKTLWGIAEMARTQDAELLQTLISGGFRIFDARVSLPG